MDSNIDSLIDRLQPYLPGETRKRKVHVTVTYAQSIDGRVAGRRGERTKISGPESSKMTHYLRSKHDGILVGKNTLIVDNPSLNCRFPGSTTSPRPILLDSFFSWGASDQEWTILKNARHGMGLPPFVLTTKQVDLESEPYKQRAAAITSVGGKVLQLADMKWPTVLTALEAQGVQSLMIEGGATVIGSSLEACISDSVIITVGPRYLGINGVEASPTSRVGLTDVIWSAIGEDTVLCARQLPDEAT